MDEDEFLALCESIWTLSEEERDLHTRAAEAERAPIKHTIADDLGLSRGPTVLDGIAERIEFNRVKRLLLLLRVQDMAAGLTIPESAPEAEPRQEDRKAADECACAAPEHPV